jgi:CHAT domain-containing protein/uncharacterized protein HemY
MRSFTRGASFSVFENMARYTPPTVCPRLFTIVQTILLIALIPLPASARMHVQLPDRRPLESGIPTKRPISKGETHEYSLTLSAGEFAKIVLRQQGIDLVLTLSKEGAEPDTIEVDGANGSAGAESVTLLGGNYVLKVRPRDKEPEPGSYEIAISERHVANEADRERVAIERMFFAAKRTRNVTSRDALTQRAEKFDEARRRWRELNDRRGEATALLNRGMEYHFLDMLPEALASYEEALQIFHELKNPLDEATVLLNIGTTKLRLADNQGSIESWLQALELFRAEDDQKRIGATLSQLGRAYYLEGELAQALRYYEEALPIRRRLNDRTGEAFTLDAIGRVYANGFADYEQALAFYRQALNLLPSSSNRRARAQVLGDIGRHYFSQQNYQAALDNYQQGLDEILDNDNTVRAEILMYCGMVYAASGEHDKALASYEQALQLQTVATDAVGRGQTLKNIGLSYSATGKHAQALQRLNEALEIWRKVMYPTAEADTRYELARVQKQLGNLDEASNQIQAALPLVETLRTKIANQHFRTSYFASAQKYYELYIDVLMRRFAATGDRSFEALALSYSESARTRSMLDTLIEVHADIRSGANAEDLKQEAALQQKLTALSQRQIINPGQSPEQDSAIRKTLHNLISEYHALEARIRERSPRYAGLTHPRPLTLEKIQELLASDQMLLEYALGDERSYVWAIKKNSVESYELPKRAEIENQAERVRRLLIEPIRTAAKNPGAVTLAARRKAKDEYEQAAASLSEMLLGRIKSLASAPRLLIVSSGKLQYVPFAALPVASRDSASLQGKVPLLQYHEIETPPSMSVLAELRRERRDIDRSKVTKTVVVIADPVFDVDDERLSIARSINWSSNRRREASNAVTPLFEGGRVPRLIFTDREAASILSVVQRGKGDKILGFRANRTFVTGTGALTRYRIVHFATHGIVNDQHPELSGLLFSLYDGLGRAQEGLLQMHAIYNLSIPAEIVVLSACETSVGTEMKGEGLPSLSRAFIYAGARRVIASLWEVGDSSTADLMRAFYRNLLQGTGPAAALRQAQLEMWKQRPKESPYHWAAFVTYGAPPQFEGEQK